MPRIRRGAEESLGSVIVNLAEQLAHELRENRASGQPVIHEQEFPTGKLKVNVFWDAWDHLSLEDRTAVILRAYELAEGRDIRDSIALASGLTIPEAHAAGMLPFAVIAMLREGDPVTPDECRRALIDEGGSTLVSAERPLLRFASQEEANEAMRRLIRRLPGSNQVWGVTQEVGRVEDWATR